MTTEQAENQARFDALETAVEEAEGAWQSAQWQLEDAQQELETANEKKAIAEAELQTFIDSLSADEREAIE